MTADFSEKQDAVSRLLQVMAMLRNPENGCPWDLQQSIASLAPYTLEEVYEVVDAIENADLRQLRDELGDLLFQIVFYAQIATEKGEFDFQDIANAITEKLVRRHPHVFPGGEFGRLVAGSEITADEVIVNWEMIKQEERNAKLAASTSAEHSSSILDDIPRAMPALERARKLQKRAANVGFDWSDVAPVIAKLKEEIAEFEVALQQEGNERMTEELGDMLFALVNIARHCQIEPEMALRGANRRFETRFRWIEQALREQGRQPQHATLQELDELWEAAKHSGL